MNYEDSPTDNLSLLKTLNKKELTTYVKGYLLAMFHIKETMIEGKMEFLNAALSLDDDEKEFLLSYVHILDTYESRIDKRTEQIIRLFPDSVENNLKIS